MPTKTDKFPGSWVSQLDWDDIANGEVWLFTNEELAENNTTAATVRVTAHTYSKEHGFKFRTKVVKGEGLYIQRRPDTKVDQRPATPTK
jgi:hypothetical protein